MQTFNIVCDVLPPPPPPSMEQSLSWEAVSISDSQIPCLLQNLNVHYCVCKSPPLVPILSQMNPFCIFPSCFPKIHSDFMFPFMPRSSVWSLPCRSFDKEFICICNLFCVCYMPFPFRLTVDILKIKRSYVYNCHSLLFPSSRFDTCWNYCPCYCWNYSCFYNMRHGRYSCNGSQAVSGIAFEWWHHCEFQCKTSHHQGTAPTTETSQSPNTQPSTL